MSVKTYRILSLTGGGARGIFQAVYLKRLSEHFPGPLHKHFDLICGTSTGALIGAAIAVGVKPGEIDRAYRELAQKVFSAKFAAPLRAGGRYDAKPLREAIRAILGDKKLCDTETDLLVTATPLDDFGHKVFSTLAGRQTADCTQLLLADIVAASASASTYFPGSIRISPRYFAPDWFRNGFGDALPRNRVKGGRFYRPAPANP